VERREEKKRRGEKKGKVFSASILTFSQYLLVKNNYQKEKEGPMEERRQLQSLPSGRRQEKGEKKKRKGKEAVGENASII